MTSPPINADTRMLDCALFYAKRLGWSIFPVNVPIHNAAGECVGCTCEHYKRSKANRQRLIAEGKGHEYTPNYKCENPGKCPAVRWSEKSTTDETQIRKWWARPWRAGNVRYFPNIGLDCGKSDVLVHDADIYKPDYGGADYLSLADRQTATAQTGRGGEHLFYDRQGLPYGNDTHGLPYGNDIRGVGGYVVLTPSLHATGQRCQWEEGFRPSDTPLLPIPANLRTILDTAHQQKLARQTAALAVTFGAVSEEAPDLARWDLSPATIERIHTPAEQGHRSEQDYAAVMALLDAGAGDDDILAVFTHYPIGYAGKFADSGADYLARTIGKCRAKLAEQERKRQQFLASLEYGLTWVLETNFATVWTDLRTLRRFGTADGYVERLVYASDSRDTKVAFYLLSQMLKYKSATIYTSKREGCAGAGVGDAAWLRALTQLHGRLFNVTAEPGKVTIVTLNTDFVSREWTTCCHSLQDRSSNTVNELVHSRETKIYAERISEDPYLTGTSRQKKEEADKAAAVAGGTRAEWLALMPKGLGETILRIHALSADGTVEEIAEAIGKPKGTVWRALRYVESLGGAESTRDGPRAKKVYSLVPNFDEWVTQLAPAMRTYGLSSERKARHLKEAQLWATMQQMAAIEAGNEEKHDQLEERLTRLGNQRLKVLGHIYPSMAQADLATLAYDVQLPQAPHPALLAKLRKLHANARMDAAEERRREGWKLTAEVQRLYREGACKHESARQLQIAGYAHRETWTAINQVWIAQGAGHD
ncbi:MAG TPA: bifunctional DNA primase/polymerase [Caldilineaceae bacterium]|nr:bifunctional DNA primase/polymerase [Caldilineaceae bacterium]